MIKARWKVAVAGAIFGLVLHFASGASSVAAITNAAPTSHTPNPQARYDQEYVWYKHVEDEAKAGRGRVQVPALIAMIDGSDPHNREIAAQLLSVIGKDAHEAVPSLIRHINDSDFFPRLRCIEALGDIGPASSSAVPVLVDALRDQEYAIANMAAWSLGEIGPKAAEAVPKLEAVILQRPKDSYFYAMVIATCRTSLARITGKQGPQVIALISMLKEPDDKEKCNFPALEATRALGKLMPASNIALPEICQELINPNFEFRAEAAMDLGIFDDLRAVPFLLKASRNDPDFAVRGTAINALGNIKGAEVNIAQLRKDLEADESRAKLRTEEYEKWRSWWMSWFLSK